MNWKCVGCGVVLVRRLRDREQRPPLRLMGLVGLTMGLSLALTGVLRAPIWLVAAMAISFIAIALLSSRWFDRAAYEYVSWDRYCGKCGYDLRATPGHRCPECGDALRCISCKLPVLDGNPCMCPKCKIELPRLRSIKGVQSD